jgi:hypothetical protein
VFHIDATGKLTLIGSTVDSKHLKPHDIALAPDGRTLYVPFRPLNHVASYPLGADGVPNAPPPGQSSVVIQGGLPAGSPTSCAYFGTFSDSEDLAVANGNLYINLRTAIDVFPLEVGTGRILSVPHNRTLKSGQKICLQYNPIPGAPQMCDDKGTSVHDTCPTSRRGHMQGAGGLIVDGHSLFAGEKFGHRIQGFTLDQAGNFPDIENPPFDPTQPRLPTTKEKNRELTQRQKNQTDVTVRYVGLTELGTVAGGPAPVIFGAFFLGRIDSFQLRANGTLPKAITASTEKEPLSSPTRSAVLPAAGGRRAVLYVAGGELDRVDAYRLTNDGTLPASATPFGATDVQDGSFPNDVVLVDTATCQ